jgi:hypothetical protein
MSSNRKPLRRTFLPISVARQPQPLSGTGIGAAVAADYIATVWETNALENTPELCTT